MIPALPWWLGGFDWQRELRGLRLFFHYAGTRAEYWARPHHGYEVRHRT